MRSRRIGLTSLYNLVNSPSCADDDIVYCRELHVALDRAVLDAYGWTDIDLQHEHHLTPWGERFTPSLDLVNQVLGRLGDMNEHLGSTSVGPPTVGVSSQTKRNPQGFLHERLFSE